MHAFLSSGVIAGTQLTSTEVAMNTQLPKDATFLMHLLGQCNEKVSGPISKLMTSGTTPTRLPDLKFFPSTDVDTSSDVVPDDEVHTWMKREVESKTKFPEPIVIFMVGGPGAGKMSVRTKCLEVVNCDLGSDTPLTEGDFVIAGIDRIVKHVFGGDRNCAGYGVDHQANRKWTAQQLLCELRKLALDQHRNLIIDGIGAGHFTLLQENLVYRKPCHSAENRNGFIFPNPPSGYKKVYICHVDIDPQIALLRASKRAVDPQAADEDKGRVVPERSLFDKHEAVDDIVPAWQNLARTNADIVFLKYDNNGKEPLLVGRIEMFEDNSSSK